jgi:hypothetical protein
MSLCPRHGDPRDTNVREPVKAPCFCPIDNLRVRMVEACLKQWAEERAKEAAR